MTLNEPVESLKHFQFLHNSIITTAIIPIIATADKLVQIHVGYDSILSTSFSKNTIYKDITCFKQSTAEIQHA
jgi:hypothetical protein